MNSTVLIIIGVAVAIAVVFFVLSKRKKKTPAPPKNNGLQGVNLGTLKPYDRPDGGKIWLDINHPFADTPEGIAKRDEVVQTIAYAIADERQTSAYRSPAWTIPPVEEYHVYIIKPMAFTEDGLPALMLQPKDASGNPMGPPIKTAGTVFNVGQHNNPSIGNPTNPFIVIAWQEVWDRMDYLYNSIVNESEHLTERWQGYSTFLQWTGANDVHRHRQPRTESFGFKAWTGFQCGLVQPEKAASFGGKVSPE